MHDNSKLTAVITQCHQGLDEFFLLHQEAILLQSFDDALQLLNCFRELHRLHMTFEDDQLIPRLSALGERARWPASLYSQEHTKVQELMERTTEDLLSLSKNQTSDKQLRREIIAFLDREKTFKGVCEHHQEREEAGILPELDKHTDEEWRASIIQPFLKQWNDCAEHCMNTVDGITLPGPVELDLRFE